MSTLMIIYGIGYMAVFLVFALLYIHAYGQRESLNLNAIETHITRGFIQRKFIYIAFGVVPRRRFPSRRRRLTSPSRASRASPWSLATCAGPAPSTGSTATRGRSGPITSTSSTGCATPERGSKRIRVNIAYLRRTSATSVVDDRNDHSGFDAHGPGCKHQFDRSKYFSGLANVSVVDAIILISCWWLGVCDSFDTLGHTQSVDSRRKCARLD